MIASVLPIQQSFIDFNDKPQGEGDEASGSGMMIECVQGEGSWRS